MTLQKLVSKRDKLKKKLANVKHEEKKSILTEKEMSTTESNPKERKTDTITTNHTEIPADTTSVMKVNCYILSASV